MFWKLPNASPGLLETWQPCKKVLFMFPTGKQISLLQQLQKIHLEPINKFQTLFDGGKTRLEAKKDKAFVTSYMAKWCLIRLCEQQRSDKCPLRV